MSLRSYHIVSTQRVHNKHKKKWSSNKLKKIESEKDVYWTFIFYIPFIVL